MSDPDPGPEPGAPEERPGVRTPRAWPVIGGRRLAAAPVVVVAVTVAVAVATGGTLWAFGSFDSSRSTGDGAKDGSAKGPTAVEVSLGACGKGWRGGSAGPQTFALHNTSSTAAEVDLIDRATGAVHGEIEGLAPGTTRELRVVLGGGSYAFTCLPDDAAAITGPTVRIEGPATGGGPAAVPVTQHDLIPVALAHQRWVADRTVELAELTAELKRAVDDGDLDAARTAWLSAHLVYARMGGAYDAFGAAGEAIDGSGPAPSGAASAKDFEGFHRVEYGLWHGESAASLRGPADRLAQAVHALRDSWPQQRLDPAQLGLRAHEILEDTARSELTGRTDYGSGTNLATARANLDGTRELLGGLRPLLTSRYPDLPRLDAWLDRTQHTLDRFGEGGHWTPLERLGRQDRQRLNSDIGQAVELLAPVATICDARRTA
ncbi:Efem/EfeO family lipoprotein [Streptomyces hundungensis]|uniref:Efem/EfeO family lipoprotein n=1 Tax=Streptomyces hundungensis TaxID=1077946 RepID=A0A387HQ40_9ACTN|nr:EfeM/EfeO family lipoprotein [Streptomyces hundungensis]AYG84733.1 Efem/EfeO family lipoprotein [Streptomyces hundungensis]